MDQEVADARARLAAKFGSSTQLGGKGTQRSVRKAGHKKNETASKEAVKLTTALKKYGVQPLPDIEELNMFKDDNTVIHFKRPTIQFSSRESILVCNGTGETKTIQELLPEILKQIGPDQLGLLQSLMGDMAKGLKDGKDAIGEEDEDDDVPPLVEGTFDKPAEVEEEKPKGKKEKKAAKKEPEPVEEEECGDEEINIDDFDCFEDTETTYKPDPYKKENEQAAADKAARLAKTSGKGSKSKP